MKKKLVSLLLASTMLASMVAGCGNSESTATTTDTSKGDSVAAGSTEAAATETTEAADSGEMAEINVSWMTLGAPDPSKTDAVVEAINKITESKINTHVNFTFYDPQSYATQVPMSIQSGEKLDLLMYTPVPGAGYTAFKSQNQLMNISDLLDKYGKDVKTALGEKLLAGTSDSTGVYGVASYRDLGSSLYAVMRKDTLDELGLTEKAQNMKTWAEYEEILKEVTSKTKLAGIGNADAQGTTLNVAPYFTGDDSFTNNSGYDQLGDGYGLIYADQKTGKVGCTFMNDDYIKAYQRANDWYKEGLVYKDAATSQDFADSLMKNDVAFSFVVNGEYGIAQTKASSTGHELVCTKIADSLITTGSTYKFGFAVPVTATEPEAAVKFLNLLYSDSDVENTLAWGVEGRDWVKDSNGVAQYPDGVSADTVLYHMGDFLNGNQFITIPFAEDKSIRDDQKKSMDSAPISKYMGFSFDATNVQTELTACFNVAQQYVKVLGSGSSDDFAGTLKECQDKLTAAGIDKVVAEYQKQLDFWVSGNN